MVADESWFTEASDELGVGFSLKIRDKLHEETSDYQTIAVYETETFGRLMTIDGLVMLTDRDNFVYHEMMTHPALFAHGRARNVVIIGGGDCGTLREVLKHDTVESVTQIDIDERVTRVAERYFPRLVESNDDPRARLAFEDGVAWMAAAGDATVDLIIIDSTDPIGPAEGLFNEAFYRQCHRVLAPHGLLVQQSESPLAHATLIHDMHRGFKRAGFAATHLLSFPQPSYPTGWWSATLAARDDLALAVPTAELDFHTEYYTPAMHHAAFAQPAFIQRALAGD
ncbi:polyamine aminopropyltransferase [Salinisphaera hydrothermalis]|uniref:Polyamine aminopropyltransferase n=1 Tax=Salinisphaera hydrothermalis (strain C41B8) TaxID=1304275 RepID=A0A084IN27_SALHC|nr:polyamine aminopropyltransferase [Salinisphaera hydrothermalis]KEZ78111.1 spermidine synthase [Salinisphaera hydrothermalis C41B8]